MSHAHACIFYRRNPEDSSQHIQPNEQQIKRFKRWFWQNVTWTTEKWLKMTKTEFVLPQTGLIILCSFLPKNLIFSHSSHEVHKTTLYCGYHLPTTPRSTVALTWWLESLYRANWISTLECVCSCFQKAYWFRNGGKFHSLWVASCEQIPCGSKRIEGGPGGLCFGMRVRHGVRKVMKLKIWKKNNECRVWNSVVFEQKRKIYI